MPRSPFVFSILELRHERAEAKPVSIDEKVDWGLDLSRVSPDEPVHADLELEPASGGVTVKGNVASHVIHTCHRCLDEWEEEIVVPITQLYLAERDDDADYAIDGAEIDLEPLLRDELLLALPLSPTCPDGCRGVVDAGQSGLNTPTPDDLGDSASPFAVLKDLLDAGE